jgi:hypothetical protein
MNSDTVRALGDMSMLLLTHTMCVLFGMLVSWIIDKALP